MKKSSKIAAILIGLIFLKSIISQLIGVRELIFNIEFVTGMQSLYIEYMLMILIYVVAVFLTDFEMKEKLIRLIIPVLALITLNISDLRKPDDIVVVENGEYAVYVVKTSYDFGYGVDFYVRKNILVSQHLGEEFTVHYEDLSIEIVGDRLHVTEDDNPTIRYILE